MHIAAIYLCRFVGTTHFLLAVYIKRYSDAGGAIDGFSVIVVIIRVPGGVYLDGRFIAGRNDRVANSCAVSGGAGVVWFQEFVDCWIILRASGEDATENKDEYQKGQYKFTPPTTVRNMPMIRFFIMFLDLIVCKDTTFC